MHFATNNANLVLTGKSSNLGDACRKYKRHSLCALAIFILVSVSNDPFKQKAAACSKHFSKTQYCILNFPLAGFAPSGPSGILLGFFSASCRDVVKRLILSFPRFYQEYRFDHLLVSYLQVIHLARKFF